MELINDLVFSAPKARASQNHLKHPAKSFRECLTWLHLLYWMASVHVLTVPKHAAKNPQEHFYKFCTKLSIRYVKSYLDFPQHLWTTAGAQVLLKAWLRAFCPLILNIFDTLLQGLNSNWSFSLSPSWVKRNIYAQTQRHRHVKNVQWHRINRTNPWPTTCDFKEGTS